MGSVGKSVSKTWKKVTGSGGGGSSSSAAKATVADDATKSGVGAADATKAEVVDYGGVLAKGKRAKRGTELGGGASTFGSDTLG